MTRGRGLIEDGRDSLALCQRIIDLLEQDCSTLNESLKGDVMDTYEQSTQKDLEKMREAKRLLYRALET